MSTNTSKSLASLSMQSIGYGVGILGRQLVIYFTLPFFTNWMSQEEFGLVYFSVAIMAFANTLTTAGLHGAVFRFYHDGNNSKARRQVLGSSLFLLTFLAVLPALLLLFFAFPLAQILLNNATYAPLIQVTAILLVVDTLVNYGYILLRLQVRPLATSASNLLIAAFQMGIAVLLVYVFAGGALGYLLGLLLGEIIGLCLLVWLTRRIIAFDVSKLTMGELLRYGLPLLPAALSLWALNLADRTLIGSTLGLEQLAIYEVGYKIGSLVSLVIAPFVAAWPPFAFATMHKTNAPQIYRDTLTSLMAVCLFCVLFLLAFQSEILSLLAPPSYAPALAIIGWIAIAKTFQASYVVTSIGSKISKHTVHLSIAAMFSAAIYLVLNFLFINLWGIQGAAIATLVGYVLLALTAYMIGQRSYSFPLDWSRLIRLGGITFFSYMLINFTEASNAEGWIFYLGKISAWLSFLPLLILTGIVSIKQLRTLLSMAYEQFHGRVLLALNTKTS